MQSFQRKTVYWDLLGGVDNKLELPAAIYAVNPGGTPFFHRLSFFAGRKPLTYCALPNRGSGSVEVMYGQVLGVCGVRFWFRVESFKCFFGCRMYFLVLQFGSSFCGWGFRVWIGLGI